MCCVAIHVELCSSLTMLVRGAYLCILDSACTASEGNAESAPQKGMVPGSVCHSPLTCKGVHR